MKIKVATIFPEMFEILDVGIIGRAKQNGLIDIQIYNIRDYSADKHKKTDDAPFGGGAGMVMTPQPIHDAISIWIKIEKPKGYIFLREEKLWIKRRWKDLRRKTSWYCCAEVTKELTRE